MPQRCPESPSPHPHGEQGGGANGAATERGHTEGGAEGSTEDGGVAACDRGQLGSPGVTDQVLNLDGCFQILRLLCPTVLTNTLHTAVTGQVRSVSKLEVGSRGQRSGSGTRGQRTRGPRHERVSDQRAPSEQASAVASAPVSPAAFSLLTLAEAVVGGGGG